MSASIKLILLSLCVVCLTACGTTTVVTEPIESPKLGIKPPPPLNLRKVEWGAQTDENGQVLYTLDQANYDKQVKNDEALQNRLKLQNSIILKQKTFYEGS